MEYMLANCPDLGLPLADTATASMAPSPSIAPIIELLLPKWVEFTM